MFNWHKKNEETTQVDAEIICLLDKSGSMYEVKHEAVDGFNSFLRDQREEFDSASFSLILFDHRWELFYDHVDLKDAKSISDNDYRPGGKTSLHDAIFKTVHHTDERLKKYPDGIRPKVVMMILTDGHDTSSTECTAAGVAELIKDYSGDKDWEFFFITTSQQAYTDSQTMGFKPSNTQLFSASKQGMADSMTGMTQMLKKWKKRNLPPKDPEDDNKK